MIVFFKNEVELNRVAIAAIPRAFDASLSGELWRRNLFAPALGPGCPGQAGWRRRGEQRVRGYDPDGRAHLKPIDEHYA